MFAVYQYFIPSQYVRKVYDISPEMLLEQNVTGIITDLDNTLVEWDRADATPMLIDWLKGMKDAGIQVVIVSNNNELRVKSFADPLGIPFIFQARKPMGRAFRKALAIMHVKRENVVVIGDQMLTDIFGGNLNKFHTILVLPVAQSDGFFTRFNRMVERRIMKKLKQKGQLTWEEEN
ncbi:YqeG family HAD IIIA-type phosphatase [Planococcus sp. 107-1]|uniref:YqeG family HAD IIIA-type phosphatase n=1 Tax=Planococcus sp. 107-1 TaxID=2908840 RepID=UPI0021A44A71|nr:YqeG family HAD IIIA-type phosphatase [Planococcus sp. 107-1]